MITYAAEGEGPLEDVLLFRSDDGTLPLDFEHDTIAEISGRLQRTSTFARTGGQGGQRRGSPSQQIYSTDGCRNVRVIPADSINPQRMYCLQWETTPLETTTASSPVDHEPVREMAWRLGGQAAVITTRDGVVLRGYVLQCPLREGRRRCL